MSDLSLTSGATFTSESDPTKQEEEVAKAMAVEHSNLRPRRSIAYLPKIEQVDINYRDLILTLPFEKAWSIRQYRGYWEYETRLPGILKMQEVFMPRLNDIIVAGYMKSGTTWLKALVFTIVHRDKYTFSDHPLLKLSPHDCVRQIEDTYAFHDEQYLETLPAPRVLGTHAPYPILPESVKVSKCPIIYICREPKDALVSFWHMQNLLSKRLKVDPVPFAETFELFCMGKMPTGPIWDHAPGYYTKSLLDHNKILFLKYEEMMSNPLDGVTKIANFIGSPFSEEEVKKGVVEEIVRFCSFENMKELGVSKNVGVEVDGAKNHIFFRKGVIGDWENHMTAEMAAKLDAIIKEKLQGSGFTY